MNTGGGVGGGGSAMERQRWADNKVYKRKSFKGLKTHMPLENSQSLASQDLNSSKEHHFNQFDAVSGDSSSLNRLQGTNSAHCDTQSGNGTAGSGFLRADNRISIVLATKSNKEKRDLKKKLQGELNLVRNLVKKIEKIKNLKSSVDEDCHGGRLKRVDSEVGSIGGQESRPLEPLIIPVIENSLGASDNVEKEKRTPKANPFYQSSDFILGKDKVTPQEKNKKPKTNDKKMENWVLGWGTHPISFSRAAVLCLID
ncbi:hypothetical protein Nepgr_014460 [Nepenthes gracilis]|uniref:Uncharacterized protein n=1 Tax=Nepenthes gracilis TaxID=150966 RepID=A0AAD3SKV5_NEPGR|nr:hypothetical protein Nepgr_014460 [Nepenthes gracilis]